MLIIIIFIADMTNLSRDIKCSTVIQ